jgi:hypothetical protein
MTAFEFSEGLLQDLESVQRPTASGKRGKVDRKSVMRLARQIGRSLPPWGSGGGTGGNVGIRSARAVSRLKRTASRAPEVVFKKIRGLSGTAETLGGFTYIGHVGKKDMDAIGIETSEGDVLMDATEMAKLAREWDRHEQSGPDRRKSVTAQSLVFSMPPGTDPARLREAVVALAEKDFGDRRWALAMHVEEAHPHVHVMIATRNDAGQRLWINREFCATMRERFAEELRERGIEANATIRRERGFPGRHEATIVRQVTDEYQAGKRAAPSKAFTAMMELVAVGIDPHGTTIQGRDAAKDREAREREGVRAVYARAIDELVKRGGAAERAIAASLQKFVQEMPGVQSAAIEIRDRLERAGLRALLPKDRLGQDDGNRTPDRDARKTPAESPAERLQGAREALIAATARLRVNDAKAGSQRSAAGDGGTIPRKSQIEDGRIRLRSAIERLRTMDIGRAPDGLPGRSSLTTVRADPLARDESSRTRDDAEELER